MRPAILSLAIAFASAGGAFQTAAASGVTICSEVDTILSIAVGYVGANGPTSVGWFDNVFGQNPKCNTYLTDVAEGPFYVVGVDIDDVVWLAKDNEPGRTFCLSPAGDMLEAPNTFTLRNDEHMKDGKLACPEISLRFIEIRAKEDGRPTFTFTDENAAARIAR